MTPDPDNKRYTDNPVPDRWSGISPWWRLALFAAVMLAATSGGNELNELDRIHVRGSLVMLTVNGAATYYLGALGETGFEYDLAGHFADYLGVPLEVITVPTLADLMPALEQGLGDFIAANLSRTAAREARVRFGPAYEEVTQVVVYRRGAHRPGSLEDMTEGRLAIVDGTVYERLLEQQAERIDLAWDVPEYASIEDLFDAITSEELDYTIIDSNILALNRRFFPAIRPAFDIGEVQELAWATRLGDDDTLAQKMREFFFIAGENGVIEELRQRHYEHVDRFEPIGTFAFMHQMRQRLPEFRPLFEEAADSHGLDWRLVAAVGYQESHWDPDAVSPTGVRGIMMLTRQTAEHLGVEDREDPVQSIEGGARYLRAMIDRMPERIDYPDRLWLALAAYNIGYGHLEDARVLTQRQGDDPDRWVDVREHLPSLTQERYFRNTRFGYARGHQAVSFVENIRTYYEILLWLDGREHPLIARSDGDIARG